MTALYITITVLWGFVSFAFGCSTGRQLMLNDIKKIAIIADEVKGNDTDD